MHGVVQKRHVADEFFGDLVGDIGDDLRETIVKLSFTGHGHRPNLVEPDSTRSFRAVHERRDLARGQEFSGRIFSHGSRWKCSIDEFGRFGR